MKKLFFIAILALGISAFATAQTNDKAIGLRGGWGTELSYQQPLSGSTRLEVDLGLPGWKYSGIVLSGIHQWVMNIDGGLDWYAGLGGQVGSIRWDKNESSGIGLGLAGQIGIEYNFPIPLQMSLDWRPTWYLIPSGKPFGYEGVAFGIRYRF